MTVFAATEEDKEIAEREAINIIADVQTVANTRVVTIQRCNNKIKVIE